MIFNTHNPRIFVASIFYILIFFSNTTLATIPPSTLSEFGTITLESTHKPKLTVSVMPGESKKCNPLDDCFVLGIKRDGDDKTSINRVFNSSYSSFLLFLVDLTGDMREEIILVTAEGKGTSAVSKNLTVFQIIDNDLKEILKTPYSSYFGNGLMWRYEPSFISQWKGKNSPQRIIEMQLQLYHDPWKSNEKLVSPELIPSKKIIHFRWNTNKSTLEETQ